MVPVKPHPQERIRGKVVIPRHGKPFVTFYKSAEERRHDADLKQMLISARNKRIFNLWLACYTQEEIAEKVDLNPTDKALRVSGKVADLPKNQKPAAEHLVDFEVSDSGNH